MASQGRSGTRFVELLVFAGLVLPLCGCQSLVSAINACNESNSLLDSARSLRDGVVEVPPVPRELDKALITSLTAEPGDVLLVQPADLDSPLRLPGDQPVLPDGTISLGKYGRLNVAGKNLDQIEEMVKGQVSAVVKDVGPITVRLITRQSKVYYVVGEVNAPGAYPLNGRETVLDAILQAGGLNEKASRQNIILSRPTPPESCRIVLPVCYKEITQLGDTTTNYQLKPGDRVFIPSRDFWKDRNSKNTAPICCKSQEACDLQGKMVSPQSREIPNTK